MTDAIDPTADIVPQSTPLKGPTGKPNCPGAQQVHPDGQEREGWSNLTRRSYAAAAAALFAVGVTAGVLCRSIPTWDLTQPQGVVIGGLISGAFLVLAAWIAFHGQTQNRIDERERHNRLLDAQREQSRAELAAQREQWRAEHIAASHRLYRQEVREVYVRHLECQHELSRALHDLAFNLWHAPEEVNATVHRYTESLQRVITLHGEVRLVSTEEVDSKELEFLEQANACYCALEELVDKDGPHTKAAVKAVFAGDELAAALNRSVGAVRRHLDSLLPNSTA